jgi:hypothetical protein
MKAFIISPTGPSSKIGTLISLVSALGSIESIGFADSLVEAINIIGQRYPNALIFDSRVLKEKGQDYLVSSLESRGSFIMMPNKRDLNDKYLYIGIDFSIAEQKGGLSIEISQTLWEHQFLAAE